MALKKYKPISNGRRNMSSLNYKENLSGHKFTKSLTKIIPKNAGRNNTGSIVVRHKGGGVRKRYRVIDFKRNKDDIPAKIKTIEYDPNRSANISLVVYKDGTKKYILTPRQVEVGAEIMSGKKVEIQNGNATSLINIPEGTFVHNIELHPGAGGQIARSAGQHAQILGQTEEGKYITLKLKSGEVRKVLGSCRATIGTIANEEHSLVVWGKAGRSRHRGIRPTVRGSVMNPNDHPHGGGEGKQPIGRKTPLTPWGKKALGVKTRNTKKKSSKLILRRRKAGK